MKPLLAVVSWLAMLWVAAAADDVGWVNFPGGEGPGKGKHVVLLAGDEEYRSEDGLPMLGRILSQRHGFNCTVLFSVSPEGWIDPNARASLGHPAALDTADVIVMLLRFREWPDAAMKHFAAAMRRGVPVIALRTSTHAFQFPDSSAFKEYNHFGKRVLGEQWVSHWGRHKAEATRGIIEAANAGDPVLRGVTDVFGNSDVYEAAPPADARILLRGQVLKGMNPGDEPANYLKKRADGIEQAVNDPMMPVAWTREVKNAAGASNKILCTTMGAATDLSSEGLRRLVVNGVFWGLGLEVPAKADVTIVGTYEPLLYGFNGFRRNVLPSSHALPAKPRDTVTPDAAEWPPNHRLHVEFAVPSRGTLRLGDGFVMPLAEGLEHDVAVEHPANGVTVLRVWSGGKLVRGPEEIKGVAATARPVLEAAAGVVVRNAWVQALERSDHAALVAGWNPQSLDEGRQIYNSLCVVCHGTRDKPGSLPTAMRFAEGQFKNGSDPYSMYRTLSKGFGQMVMQPQLTTAQLYAVIHYIRESYLRPHNPGQWFKITPEYLASLPKGLARTKAEMPDRQLPQYQRMDFGPALFHTYQIAPGNIAQKGIAIRLDAGPGGVSKGRAWMVYDHDTMRLAAATTGSFIDWKSIDFDGSHGTHVGLTGERHVVNPVGPGWASPEGKWDDARLRGRDQLAYGPLPRAWACYEGLYLQGDKVVIAATIGGTRVLESPGWLENDATPVFIRTLNVAAASRPLLMRVAPDTLSVVLTGDGVLRKDAGFWIAELPGAAKTRLFISRTAQAALATLGNAYQAPPALDPLTQGGPTCWPQHVTTTSVPGTAGTAFIADTFPLPVDNPWQSWMRPGGFDFTPDGKAAILAMWNGDVWRVDGVMDPAPATLRWRRIASGLFQPLGVKFRGSELFITCRDQLARLRDLNNDGEIDFIECFNNDHQVTEHFHEFAMGLQTDAAGNFYYAKSARHALPALVPHHGTLLRISADGSHTDILANGFRAANGICLNPDGTFFVTDQEGHWTPKNRINRVTTGGFYGNMLGYGEVTDPADSAMEQPMVWITNAKDRSPGELLWVPDNIWGALGGSLLNLSYGTGRAFIVPHELAGGRWQGAVCELPMPAFATGIMRGRFAADGALYTCGMFAWAGNATTPGGFYRIRRGDQAAHVPLAIHPASGVLRVTFSDPLDQADVKPDAFTFKVWSLKRTAGYGSQHYDEHSLPITAARIGKDARTLTLDIPALSPTQCYELTVKLRGSNGSPVERSIHGTILHLSEQ
jgi:mono/diheme cytochrome c family protein